MANAASDETNLQDGERESRDFHVRVAADAVDIWRRNLNRLMRATDDLGGRTIGEEAEAVQFALFFRSWNTIYCASDVEASTSVLDFSIVFPVIF